MSCKMGSTLPRNLTNREDIELSTMSLGNCYLEKIQSLVRYKLIVTWFYRLRTGLSYKKNEGGGGRLLR